MTAGSRALESAISQRFVAVAVAVGVTATPVSLRAAEPAVVAPLEPVPAPGTPHSVEPWGYSDEEWRRSALPPRPPPPTGTGLLVAGGVTMGLGLLGLLGGGLLIRSAAQPERHPPCEPDPDAEPGFGSNCSDFSFAAVGRGIGGFFLMVASVAPILGGGVMLGVGGARHHRYRRWQRSLQPALQRSAHGTWTAGVTLRF